ncbi:MAG: MaoC family dehydratase N-terminal domain-containing protein [Rhizobiaceae bacterium]|nr:MaoC family dehydratase N-terminal domain-containing protein [Rhizobiaceae bacterium]
MSEVDIAHLRQWIGREQQLSEMLTEGLVERFDATLGNARAKIAEDAPLAIHWCLTQPTVQPDELGKDGHPARGNFLPPVSLPRRMWAGGELTLLAPLRIDEVVTRSSRIADVTHKTGRSGDLVFVTVEHQIISAGRVAVRERQDIVYRGEQLTPAQPAKESVDPRQPEFRETVKTNTTLLFRYSALTFNGHRIHYDLDYAREQEGYAGLVVHGPLQATLLLHFAARISGNRTPIQFSYRGVAPLICGDDFSVNATRNGKNIDLWTAGSDGATRMTAQAVMA